MTKSHKNRSITPRGPRFNITEAEGDIITKIVERAWDIESIRDGYNSKLDLRMDLMTVHANGNPLRLGDLLISSDFNFMHDIFGIRRHLDRDTGKLGESFSPRFSQRQTEAA